MRGIGLFGLTGAVALLAACEADVEPRQEAAPVEAAAQRAEAPAEGKAEDGRLSMKGPGFDFKIDIPQGVKGEGDNDLLYPGATLKGMHIEAGEAKGKAAASGVELRFTSADAPDKVAAWYRGPARRESFSVASAAREGDALILRGTEKGGEPFTVRLSPSGSGTEGRLTLTDRR